MEGVERRQLRSAATQAAPFALDVSTSPMRTLRPWFPRSYVVTESVRGIERFFDDQISICIWRRGPDVAIQQYLFHLQPHKTIERAERVRMDQPAFDSLLRDFPDLPELSHLNTELQGLTDLFATLSDSQSIGVRLMVTRSAPCPRFHVDRVGLRLICTWQGCGTEWLEHQAVNRRYLGAAAGLRDEESGLLAAGAQIHRMHAFDVGLFKGERWPNNAGRGAVHRSPAPDARGQWRVMVSLDELD
jgi:hypothetical protein